MSAAPQNKMSRAELLATLNLQLAQLPLEVGDMLEIQLRFRLTETKVLQQIVREDVLGLAARKAKRLPG